MRVWIVVGCLIVACTKSATAAPPTHRTRTATAASPPAKLADDWKGLKALRPAEVRVWVKDPKAGFGLGTHRAIAERAAACSEELVAAQYRQDTREQFSSAAHFDNCAFDDAETLITSEITAIDALLTNPAKPTKAAHLAMSRIGRVLHAIQDFYAHSNWVELQHAANVDFDRAQVHVWTAEGQTQLDAQVGLASGVVWWGSPKRCAAGTPSHGEMSKDSPRTPGGKAMLSTWERSGFNAAASLAERSTVAFLGWCFERWPVLARECGGELYVAPLSDRRP